MDAATKKKLSNRFARMADAIPILYPQTAATSNVTRR
jgi:hypothetical protein